jgi:hypothetical protein
MIDILIQYEKIYTIHYTLGDIMLSATLGMVIWDRELAQAQIADRLGLSKERILIISHKEIKPHA